MQQNNIVKDNQMDDETSVMLVWFFSWCVVFLFVLFWVFLLWFFFNTNVNVFNWLLSP